MKVKTSIIAHILDTFEETYTNKDGELQKYYKTNIMQDSGRFISELKVSKEIAAQLERGKEYTLCAEYSETKFGNTLKITGVQGANITGGGK